MASRYVPPVIMVRDWTTNHSRDEVQSTVACSTKFWEIVAVRQSRAFYTMRGISCDAGRSRLPDIAAACGLAGPNRRGLHAAEPALRLGGDSPRHGQIDAHWARFYHGVTKQSIEGPVMKWCRATTVPRPHGKQIFVNIHTVVLRPIERNVTLHLCRKTYLQVEIVMADNSSISTDPAVCGGRPHIAGTRISVELIMDHVAAGHTAEQIQQAYPHLSIEQIEEATRYGRGATAPPSAVIHG